jgi:SAM-dependent methyltransferase
MKINILEAVNKIYKKENPSTYFKNTKEIKSFVYNRKKLLFKLKLPIKIFKDSKLIDFGAGSGQNTLPYDWFGAKCTLIEYDKKSFHNSKLLFKKYAKQNFKIINKDIFKLKNIQKFDIVISNGVAHHTKDPKKSIKICINSLKKDGFFILGIGNKNGFFQRNIQRLILYKISNNEREILENAKILFHEHLKRSVKYSGRHINEIIYDTYINPKINTLSTDEIEKIFKRNKITLYSSFTEIKKFKNFLNPPQQFSIKKQIINKKYNDLNISDLQELTLTNNQNDYNYRYYSKLKKIFLILGKLAKDYDNLNFYSKNTLIKTNQLYNIKNKIKRIEKIDILNKNYNIHFFNELIKVFKVLNLKCKKYIKLRKIKFILKNNKFIFKKYCGVGMNYYVGYKE